MKSIPVFLCFASDLRASTKRVHPRGAWLSFGAYHEPRVHLRMDAQSHETKGVDMFSREMNHLNQPINYCPSLPVIPPEVRCFRYVFGVQIPPHQVFGSLGLRGYSFVFKKNGSFSCYSFHVNHPDPDANLGIPSRTQPTKTWRIGAGKSSPNFQCPNNHMYGIFAIICLHLPYKISQMWVYIPYMDDMGWEITIDFIQTVVHFPGLVMHGSCFFLDGGEVNGLPPTHVRSITRP